MNVYMHMYKCLCIYMRLFHVEIPSAEVLTLCCHMFLWLATRTWLLLILHECADVILYLALGSDMLLVV